MKLSRFYTLATIALIAAVSCQKEDIVEPAGQKAVVSDNIVFSASSAAGSETKAQYVGDMELTNEKGETITLTMSVMDNVESLPDQMSGTKGALISASNFTTYVKDIAVMGYLNASTDLYVGVKGDAETISQTGTHSDNNTYSTHWAPAHNYYWPKAHSLDFWAWAPKAAIDAASAADASGVKITNWNVSNATGSVGISFHYDLGSTDATAQPDLMFANSANISQTTGVVNDGCVPLDFKHALAAIQFKVVSTKGAKINYIKLVDVAKTGDCAFTSGGFDWTNNEVSTTNKATYNHGFDADVTANTPSNFYASDPTANFMMIPQTLGTQKIEISISIDGNSAPEIFTGTIPTTSNEEWSDGKVYIYTINIDENVNVNITDEVTSSNVKQKVEIRNTGNVNVYLRAAIVGNWKDANGKIINEIWSGNGTWTAKTPSGTDISSSDIGTYFYTGLSGKTDIGTGWVRGADGYYYYRYQVPAGEVTVGTLFDTYTPVIAGDDITPKNAHLELSVAVQAIQANLLVQADGTTMKEEASAYGWKTSVLSTEVDALSNFTSGK